MPKGVPMKSSAKRKAALTRCVTKCKKSQSASAKKQKSARKKAAAERAGQNPWIRHVQDTREAGGKDANGEYILSYKAAMVAAKATYVRKA